jgi:hypothetical protein
MTRARPSARPVAISPETLDRAPHLGVLVVVDHAIGVAVSAVMAEFPALMGDPHPWRPDPPDQAAARRLVRHLCACARALSRYRRALKPLLEPPPPPPSGNDDLDF